MRDEEKHLGSEDPRPASAGSHFHAQVLILLFTALFFTGSGGESLPERVQKAVKDADRARVAGNVALHIEERNEAVLRGIVDLRGELFRILGDYSASETEWGAVLDAATSLLSEGEEDLLGLRFELRDKMTEPEWHEMFEALREDKAHMGW